MTLTETMKENAALTDAALPDYLKTEDEALAVLYDSMRYSALSGGKRIRPFLVLAFCKLFGGTVEAALPFACALECVHASSLIHDDLPAMDNDALRRGKPTNHIVYGEDIALLAGDALMTRGYEIAAENDKVSPEIALLGVKKLLHASGAVGMMGGQEIDLLSENKEIPFELLLKMHAKKTGALIGVAARLGCLAAGLTDDGDPRVQAAMAYAGGIGLVFQIVDDILDVTGDAATLGKATHADGELGKTTFLTFMDVEEAKNYAKDVTEQAVSAIRMYENSDILVELADYLCNRTS